MPRESGTCIEHAKVPETLSIAAETQSIPFSGKNQLNSAREAITMFNRNVTLRTPMNRPSSHYMIAIALTHPILILIMF